MWRRECELETYGELDAGADEWILENELMIWK